eukprot:1092664-Pelagomonas_calceolata.AAC.1
MIACSNEQANRALLGIQAALDLEPEVLAAAFEPRRKVIISGGNDKIIKVCIGKSTFTNLCAPLIFEDLNPMPMWRLQPLTGRCAARHKSWLKKGALVP